MDESKRAVPTAKGQALADDYFIKFFRTVNSYAVLFCCFTDELILILFRTVFFRVPRLTSMWSKFSSPLPETLSRLSESDSKPEDRVVNIRKDQGAEASSQKSACCGT